MRTPLPTLLDIGAGPSPIHHHGVINAQWPLCQEAEAVARGWTAAAIRNGEPATDDDGTVLMGSLWGRLFPEAQCCGCRELVHA